MSKIGFNGLGIMGTPMAEHLLQAGHELFLHDVKPLPAEFADSGAHARTCARGGTAPQ